MPKSSYGNCTCGVNDKIDCLQHHDYIMLFLNGLSESHAQVRTQILMMDPTPSIIKVFSLVTREEIQKSIGSLANPNVESTALAAKTSNSNFNGRNFKNNNGKGRSICSHCGKLGHIMEKCYRIVSYAPGYNQKRKGSTVNQVSSQEEYSDGNGQNFNNSANQGLNFSNSVGQNQSFPFSQKQYRQLLILLDNQFSNESSKETYLACAVNTHALSGIELNSCPDSSTFNFQNSAFVVNPIDKHAFDSDTWVLDTGATDHIVHSTSFFTSITSIKHTFVHSYRHNSRSCYSCIKGCIMCTFHYFQLISITKLTKTMSCCLIFLSEFCFIQDLLCWK